MTLDLKQVKLFARASVLGAIGKAGEELGLSATNASHRIKLLEDELGVRPHYAGDFADDGRVSVSRSRAAPS
ncbi:LysR family transcriptional regulator [Shinella sp. 838]|uniref:helix-turn-helix domain-containing protein n=1 Tax=Shinella sp. 838 TaxID=3038164 RepID=UPI0024158328|nr:LysR family transcriptional regulator [Shinella sp. 838]MDG4674905.1 LysR family transcriptional regulator [Shinella sp. 838]